MKKIWKVILIVSIVIFVLGILLIGASLLSGGSLDSIVNNIESVDYSENFDKEEIKAVDIDLTGAKLFVVPGEYFAVVAEKMPTDYFSCRVEDGTLKIEEKWPSSNAKSVSMGLAAYKYEPKVTLYVPSDFQELNSGTSVSISMDAGICHIEKLAAENVDLNLGAGNLLVSDFDAYNLSLKLASGNASLTGSISGSGELRCGAGSVGLKLDGSKSDYEISANMFLGKLIVGNRWFSGCWRYSNAGEGAKLDALMGSGNLTIKFEQ
jgi:hypothetical protein